MLDEKRLRNRRQMEAAQERDERGSQTEGRILFFKTGRDLTFKYWQSSIILGKKKSGSTVSFNSKNAEG